VIARPLRKSSNGPIEMRPVTWSVAVLIARTLDAALDIRLSGS
jgi:hypothetical protein